MTQDNWHVPRCSTCQMTSPACRQDAGLFKREDLESRPTIAETVNTAATLMPPVTLAAPDRHMSEEPVVQEVVRQLSTPSFAPIDAVGV